MDKLGSFPMSKVSYTYVIRFAEKQISHLPYHMQSASLPQLTDSYDEQVKYLWETWCFHKQLQEFMGRGGVTK